MERLTGTELERLHKLTVISWPDNSSRAHAELALARAVPQLLAEIKARRAADLTSEDVEALGLLQTHARVIRFQPHVEDRGARALHILDKLIAAHRSRT